MPFVKNDDRINRAGRPPGTKNRVNQEIRQRINNFLDENFDSIQNDLLELEPRERVKFYIDLLQYGLPKLKQVELSNDPDAISHEDLDTVLKMLADAK